MFELGRARRSAGPRCTTRSPRRRCRRPDSARRFEDPGALRSRAYDLVVDGAELGGGSIRIHDPQLQEQVLAAHRHRRSSEAQARFGFLLDALRYGAPPHGGIALGIDRIVAMCAGARIDPRRDRLPQDRQRRRPAHRRARAGRPTAAAGAGSQL